MNKSITSLYVVNKDNTTIAYGSNLSDMVKSFQSIEANARNYQYYYRKFLKTTSFVEEYYHFQRVF